MSNNQITPTKYVKTFDQIGLLYGGGGASAYFLLNALETRFYLNHKTQKILLKVQYDLRF